MEFEIKTTEEIFDELCDDCGTHFHERPKQRWINLDHVLDFLAEFNCDNSAIIYNSFYQKVKGRKNNAGKKAISQVQSEGVN